MDFQEFLANWIQPSVVIITGLFVAYQTFVQNSKEKLQKDIMDAMSKYNSMIDLDVINRVNEFKIEAVKLQTDKEKQELIERIQRDNEYHNEQMISTKAKFDERIGHFETVEQKFNATSEELEKARKEIDFFRREMMTSFKNQVELVEIGVLLTATYIPQSQWTDFIDKNLKNSADIFKPLLDRKGEEISDKAKEQLQLWFEIRNEFFHRSGFVKKLIKSSSYPKATIIRKAEKDKE